MKSSFISFNYIIDIINKKYDTVISKDNIQHVYYEDDGIEVLYNYLGTGKKTIFIISNKNIREYKLKRVL